MASHHRHPGVLRDPLCGVGIVFDEGGRGHLRLMDEVLTTPTFVEDVVLQRTVHIVSLSKRYAVDMRTLHPRSATTN